MKLPARLQRGELEAPDRQSAAEAEDLVAGPETDPRTYWPGRVDAIDGLKTHDIVRRRTASLDQRAAVLKEGPYRVQAIESAAAFQGDRDESVEGTAQIAADPAYGSDREREARPNAEIEAVGVRQPPARLLKRARRQP